MADEKEPGKFGSWFSDINRLLLILVAGTVLVSEVPFHNSRPSRQASGRTVVAQVDSRLWQDPFEGLHGRIEKGMMQGGEGNVTARFSHPVKRAYGSPEKAQPKNLNVVALMLPGGPYYEEGETRRRLRYAVLSGFDAARRYMPDDPEHLRIIDLCGSAAATVAQGNLGVFCEEGAALGQVVYEWLVYKPLEPGAGSGKVQRDRAAPILLLYLNNDLYRGEPLRKLKALLTAVKQAACRPNPSVSCVGDDEAAATAPDWHATILGPYDSDNLQDLVSEVLRSQPMEDLGRVPRGLSLRFYSPSASLQDEHLLPRSDYGKGTSISEEFARRNLPFLRVGASDESLARAASQELRLRGVVVGPRSRVLLLGEWDTLYGWHLPGTFAEALLHEPDADCPVTPGSREGRMTQDHEDVYPDSVQCVLQFSYLRGLDGEKARYRERSEQEGKERGDPERDPVKRLEDADGDSQFDYLRRLASRLTDLDRNIRIETANPAAHPIKAIGVLGSDVYDKLLVLEAMHERFPDALYFTNDLDARFLHPDKNKWARNLVIISDFGLDLGRELQRDIPPFRDSAQTAFFLATEMALSRMEGLTAIDAPESRGEWLPDSREVDEAIPCPRLWCLGEGWRHRLGTNSQKDVDEFLGEYPRLHEVGRTRIFPLDPSPGRSLHALADEIQVHPRVPISTWSTRLGVFGCLLMVMLLLVVAPARRFLCTLGGFYLSLLTAVIVIGGSLFVASSAMSTIGASLLIARSDGGQGDTMRPLLMGLACLYIAAMLVIVVRDEASVEHSSRSRRIWYLPVSLALLTASYAWLFWHAAAPGHQVLDQGEIYALAEGVSMWPTEGMRLLALILAGYFIIEVCRLPIRFASWLENHFDLFGLGATRTRCRAFDEFAAQHLACEKGWEGWRASVRNWLIGPPDPQGPNRELAARLERYAILNDWLAWRRTPRRLVVGVLLGVAYYYFGLALFQAFGFPRLPFRGETMLFLDHVLMRGLLVPAFALLLMLVVDTVWVSIRLIERSFPDEGDQVPPVQWPEEALAVYAKKFKLDASEMGPWVEMRFIEELTRRIYAIIGYPLIVALLMVLARSNVNDNFVMPVAFKLVVLSSLGLLFVSDHWLKKAADGARTRALKTLRARITQCKGDETGQQLERLSGMIENSDQVVYQSFTQRPIFRGSLLLLAALLADFADYSTLASRLF